MLLHSVAVSGEGMGVVCLLLLIAWVILAVGAVVKAVAPRVMPTVSAVALAVAALLVFLIWVIVC